MTLFPFSDQASPKYYLLDMGQADYGDCTLCVFPEATVLIDGGHPGDYDGQPDVDSIPEQLADILGKPPPFAIDLLVVTHCHGDHIGCLPELVANGDLRVKWALVADEDIGFGRSANDGLTDELLHSDAYRLAAALREEPHDYLVGAALDRFLSDAAKVEPRYRAMLQQLEQDGTRVVRYGRDAVEELETIFSAIGFTVLGPSEDHLRICADAIVRANQDAMAAAEVALQADASLSPAALYRQLVNPQGFAAASDRPGKGSAINGTSIVLKMGTGKKAVLLAGDLQFAKPEVPSLAPHVDALITRVAEYSPYCFLKLTHHSSYNGIDQKTLDRWSGARYLGHSGGSKDRGHPSKSVLDWLRTAGDRIVYARTDRNGQIRFTPGRGFTLSRGTVNDFSPNGSRARHDEPGHNLLAAAESTVTGGIFRSTARIPFGDGEITLTFEVQPSRKEAGLQPRHESAAISEPPSTPPPPREDPVLVGNGKLGGGRILPKLLFVTQRDRLKANIGAQEADDALRMITAAGQKLLEVQNAADPFPEIRNAIDSDCRGVVVVGGYDVLPAQRLDVLSPQLHTQLKPQEIRYDPDGFIIWSDFAYGDTDGDGLPELPVSRIPDARKARLVQAALSAAPVGTPSGRFGIRNSARKFAEHVWLTGQCPGPLHSSGPISWTDIASEQLKVPWVYFMLHGSDVDSSRFWGEVPGYVEAMNVSKIPRPFAGIAFAGCCWGALTVQQTAYRYTGGPIAPKTPEHSIALSLLEAGGLAFVGCTGVHYSPDESGAYFGGPMHRAFWASLTERQLSPAQALHEARLEYLAGMPHGQASPMGMAVERKILMQFTCLGLGW